jgi:hypothetical protein
VALVDCSECGKEVSSFAKSCPNCGNPDILNITEIRVQAFSGQEAQSLEESETKLNSTFLATISCVFVILILLGTFYALTHKSDSVSSPNLSSSSSGDLSAGDKEACKYFKDGFTEGMKLPFNSPKLKYVLDAAFSSATNLATNPSLKLDFKIMLDAANGVTGVSTTDAQIEINQICG